jgi:dTDP-4-amino-4,6-dideoxygalactose transaminase
VVAALEQAARLGLWGRYHSDESVALAAELANYHQTPHVLLCASGTLAVELALRAVGVVPGDEVLLAAYEYEGNFHSVHAVGASPVLVDVTSDSWQLDPEQLLTAASPRTRAVICSHLHGGLVEMPAVMELARQQGWYVIEDAAQAVGARCRGRPVGTWGDIGVLSFGGSKLLCAGRGGALLCRDQRLAQRLRSLLRRGPQEWAALSELQAAVLRPQLRRLEADTLRRAEHAELLRDGLGSIPGLRLLAPHMQPEHRPAFYKLGLDYDAQGFGLPRELFLAAMQAEGIAIAAGWRALHIQRSPSRYRAAGPLGHAEIAHRRCVLLDHPVLLASADEVRHIIAAVARIYRHRHLLASLTPAPPHNHN